MPEYCFFLRPRRGRYEGLAAFAALAILGVGCATPQNDGTALSPEGVIDVRAEPFGALGDGRANDSAAIQRAIDSAQPGDTIFFPAGTYLFSTSLMNTVGVTLLGENREKSVLRMTRDEPYGINMASGLHVRELTIRGNSTPSPRAHAFNGGNTEGAVIENCIIEHWGAVAILGADGSNRNTIRNNIIRNNAHEGVYFGTNSDENIIDGNHIHHCRKNGIDVNGSRNRIVNNTVHDIGEPGDLVDTVGIMAGNPMPHPAADNLIHGNVVYDCATHGILLWAVSLSMAVTENICYDNAGYGIFLEKLGDGGRCDGHLVTRNVVRDNGGYGIVLQAAVNSTVEANRCTGNGQDGIAIHSTNGPAERNAIRANICRNNARHGVYIGPGTRATAVAGNRISANGEADFLNLGDAISGGNGQV